MNLDGGICSMSVKAEPTCADHDNVSIMADITNLSCMIGKEFCNKDFDLEISIEKLIEER